MTTAQPQSPPFAFPGSVSKAGGEFVQDDGGDVIMMGYCGPTPGGCTSTGVYIVHDDIPTRCHPATKYAYQRYTKTAECVA